MASNKQRKPNTRLRWHRENKGWSLRKVADLILAKCSEEEKGCGITENLVGRWERGVAFPGPFYREKLCQVFELSAVELGLLEELSPASMSSTTAEAVLTIETTPPSQSTKNVEGGDVIDGEYVEVVGAREEVITENNSGLGPALESDILSRLSIVFDRSIDIGEQEISYFEQQTRLFWRVREESILSSNRLYTHVIRHLEDMTMFLTHSLAPTVRLQICDIVCRTILLAGILLYDMGYYEQARKHYLIAIQAAAEANNFTLRALVWGWMSFTWTYTKQYSEALVSVQQASHFAIQTSSTIVQAWLSAVEAEIQAHLHNSQACLQSINLMEQAFGAAPPQDISYLFEFNPVLLLGYKGVCLQRFYRKDAPETYPLLREARIALEQALASNAPMKRKLYYLSDLAGVYAREGDVEAACSYVSKTLPLIMQIGTSSKTIRQHLIQARTLLQPYQDTSSVRTLDEQMTPLLVL
jgi:transcriptional regulator with XRE-family HTH domain